jgi:hypothetical protein
MEIPLGSGYTADALVHGDFSPNRICIPLQAVFTKGWHGKSGPSWTQDLTLLAKVFGFGSYESILRCPRLKICVKGEDSGRSSGRLIIWEKLKKYTS